MTGSGRSYGPNTLAAGRSCALMSAFVGDTGSDPADEPTPPANLARRKVCAPKVRRTQQPKARLRLRLEGRRGGKAASETKP